MSDTTTTTPRDNGTGQVTQALTALDEAIDEFMAARGKVERATQALTRFDLGDRSPYELDPDDPDHIWLNAFCCIRPTDKFAADVGRTVIAKAMAHHGRRVPLTVNAS